MYHNEFFHKDSFGSAPVGRTFQRSVLRQKAEMYVTCTVLSKNCLLYRSKVPPHLPVAPPMATLDVIFYFKHFILCRRL